MTNAKVTAAVVVAAIEAMTAERAGMYDAGVHEARTIAAYLGVTSAKVIKAGREAVRANTLDEVKGWSTTVAFCAPQMRGPSRALLEWHVNQARMNAERVAKYGA